MNDEEQNEPQKNQTTPLRYINKEQRQKLKLKATQILERVRDAERLEAKKMRAEDTTRKILLGACIMHAMDTGQMDRERITAMLDAFLDKPRDRKLFDLPVRHAPGTGNVTPPPAPEEQAGRFTVHPDTPDDEP